MEVYFDNSATTKMYDEVIDEVVTGMKEFYGNPSSLHTIGLKSEEKLKECRRTLAGIINANENEIVFNGGGSEGNNFVIKALFKENRNVITTPFEHSSVINTVEEIKSENKKVIYLDVDKNGQIDINQLQNFIDNNTALVSIMHVNNEVGSIADLEAIGKLVKEKSSRAKFHVDCVQSFGKLNIDVKKMNIDFLTVSSHKFHGPKGCGFVYVKKGSKLKPLINGGAQEFGMRAGTHNVPGIMGMAKAALIANENMKKNYEMVSSIKNRFLERVKEIENVRINSQNNEHFSPYISNVSFVGIRGEVLLHFLEEKGIYVSTGSACSSKEREKKGGSYVLNALGLNKAEAESGVRFSFSDDNSIEEVDYVIDVLKEAVKFLRFR